MTLTNLKKRLKVGYRVMQTDDYQDRVKKYNFILDLFKRSSSRRAKLMQARKEGHAMLIESLLSSIDKLIVQYESKRKKKRRSNQVLLV